MRRNLENIRKLGPSIQVLELNTTDVLIAAYAIQTLMMYCIPTDDLRYISVIIKLVDIYK